MQCKTALAKPVSTSRDRQKMVLREHLCMQKGLNTSMGYFVTVVAGTPFMKLYLKFIRQRKTEKKQVRDTVERARQESCVSLLIHLQSSQE